MALIKSGATVGAGMVAFRLAEQFAVDQFGANTLIAALVGGVGAVVAAGLVSTVLK